MSDQANTQGIEGPPSGAERTEAQPPRESSENNPNFDVASQPTPPEVEDNDIAQYDAPILADGEESASAGLIDDPTLEGVAASETPETEADAHTSDSGEPTDGGRADGSDERLTSIAADLSRLTTRLEESQRLLGRQTELVERLHTENQRLKSGELRQAILPLVREFIRIHDDARRIERASSDEGNRDLHLLAGVVVEALARNGVEQVSPSVGAQVDASEHRVLGVDPSGDLDEDSTVSEVVKLGFRWSDGGLVRAAEVRAYRYREPLPVDSGGDKEAEEISPS